MKLPFSMIDEGCKDFDLTLDAVAKEQLECYAELLCQWNKRMNLTAIADPDGITEKHFLDSLLLLRFQNFSPGAKVIDVGTGAGFPGLVLKIARPDLEITLLDSLQKRLTFLKTVCQTIGLSCHTVHARAEDGGHGPLREAFDAAVARAVAPLPILCELCLPFVKPDGVFCALKGPQCEFELENSRAPELLGAQLESVASYTLPCGEERRLAVWRKKSSTLPQYPRTAAKIKKQPL